MNRSDKQSASAAWATVGFAIVIAALAVLQRYFPHPHNLFLIGALGLWGAARLNPWVGLALPVAVWGVTEVLEYTVKGQASFNPLVCLSFFAYGVLGLTLRKTQSPARIGITAIAASVQFFLITNFSAWTLLNDQHGELPAGAAMVEVSKGDYTVPLYANSFEGLMTCYAMGLPFTNPQAPPLGFFGNGVVGDLFFTALLFGLHAALLWVVGGREQLQPIHERAS
jgi:hypothetical protein